MDKEQARLRERLEQFKQTKKSHLKKPSTLKKKVDKECQTPLSLLQSFITVFAHQNPNFKENPFAFYANPWGFRLRVIHPLSGYIQSDVPLKFPPLDLFVTDNAVELAEKGHVQEARLIFDMIYKAGQFTYPRVRFYSRGTKHGLVKSSPLKKAEFWTTWTWFEEKYGGWEDSLSIFDVGLNMLQGEQLDFLQREYSAFLLRLWESFKDKDEGRRYSLSFREARIDSPEAPEFTHRSFQWSPSVSPPLLSVNLERMDESPLANRHAEDMCQLTDHLSQLRVKTPFRTFVERKKSQMIQNEESPSMAAKKKVGVVTESDGSSITLLTPIKVKKKEKEELGVSEVVTPVRRSRRLNNPDDFTPTASRVHAEDQKENIHLLLESHGYAYKPNPALKDSIKKFRTPKKTLLVDDEATPIARRFMN